MGHRAITLSMERHDKRPSGASFSDYAFNPKYTFDRFVVAPFNQFAHAAAQKVATNPGRTYNPLYIWGGTGTGKTHLMNALGHKLLSNSLAEFVVYVSAQQFFDEILFSLRYNMTEAFHRQYRSTNALFLEDVQDFQSKAHSQEELLYAFDALHSTSRQIVVTGDRPPKDIRGLDDRLRSRFESGLIAELTTPDLESKMAILKSKAEELGLPIPQEVRVYIAKTAGSNISSLQGALLHLVASWSQSRGKISVSMAKQSLRAIVGELRPTGEGRIGLGEIVLSPREILDSWLIQRGKTLTQLAKETGLDRKQL